MDYWFLFVFVVLMPCCFYSQETPDVDAREDNMDVIARNLSREHELVSILEPEVAEDILENGSEKVLITLHQINKKLYKVMARMRLNFTQSDEKTEVVEALKVYLENVNDEVERDLFLNACRKHDVGLNCKRIKKVKSLLPSRDTVKQLSDLGDFVISANFMILTVIKELILSDACLKEFNKNNLGSTSAHREKSGRDLHKFVNILKKKFLTLENCIDGTQEVKDYVGDFQLGHRHQSPQKFVDLVYKRLTEKYFWRNWLVVTFPERDTHNERSVFKVNSKYSFLLGTDNNRSMFVASPDRVHADAFTGNIDECFGQSRRSPFCGTSSYLCDCPIQKNELFSCLYEMGFKGIVCLWSGLNMKFKGGSSGYKFYSLAMPQDYLGAMHVNKTLIAKLQEDFIVIL